MKLHLLNFTTSLLLASVLFVSACSGKRSLMAGSSLNQPPVALAASFSMQRDATLTDVVTASDPDGDSLTFSLAANPAHGTISLTPAGLFIFRPTAGYVGADSFAFKVSDGKVDSTAMLVGITIGTPNEAPSGTFSADPENGISFEIGQRAVLYWNVLNATSCMLGGTAVGTSASRLSAPLVAQQTFVLSCTGPGGSRNFTKAVTALTPAITAPSSVATSAVTSNSVTLSWSHNGANTITYSVEKSDSAGGNFTAVGSVPVAEKNFVVTSLMPATDYRFRVRASSPLAQSPYSTIVNVRTLAAAPLPPPNPNGFDLQSLTDRSMVITWQPAGGSAVSYIVAKSAPNGVAPTSCSGGTPVSGTLYTATDLQPYATYGFRVCSVNSASVRSSGSVVHNQTRDRASKNIENLRITQAGGGNVTIMWDFNPGPDANVAGGFFISFVESTTAPSNCLGNRSGVNFAARSFLFSGLQASRQFSVRVCTKNGDGMVSGGMALNNFNGYPAPPPNIVSVYVLSRRMNAIEWEWVSGGGSTSGYLLSYFRGPVAPANCNGGIPVSSTRFLLTGLDAGSLYTVRVCAVNAAGVQSEGQIANGNPAVPPPPNPASFNSAIVAPTSIIASWNSGGAHTYRYLINWVSGTTPRQDCSAAAITFQPRYEALGLNPNTNYSFRVCAENVDGLRSTGIVMTVRTPP